MFGTMTTMGQRTMAALALLLCLSFSTWAGAASTFTAQERQYIQTQQRLQQLNQQRTERALQVQAAAGQLEQLKRQAKSGLLGLPARLRLSNARAKAQRLSARLAKLDKQLRKLRQQQERLRRRLRKLYRKRYNTLRRTLSKKGLKLSQRRKLHKEAKSIASRFKQLAAARQAQANKLPQLRIKIEPLDGPIELRQKADRIKDAEDNVSRILRKLKRKMKRIKKRVKRQQREDRLANWVDTSGAGDSLFAENSRNPRVVTGKSTSDRIRRENARSFRLPSLSAASPQRETSNQAGGGAPKSAAPPPAGAPTGLGNKGTTDPTARNGNSGFGSNDSAAPRGTTHLHQRVGPNTTLQPQTGRGRLPSNGYSLNPKGTLKQQLEALKRYRKHLKRYRKQLRSHHKTFVQHAKRLRQQRRRR